MLRDLTRRYRSRLWQLLRYSATSVVANLTTITVLGVLVGVVGFDAGWSNVIATAVATVPSFELNRRWVWSEHGRASLRAQVIPFWIWAFLELALSSLAVHAMGVHATAVGWSRPVRTAALETTSIGTTGCLWVIQFFLFDRVLFRRHSGARPTTATAGSEQGPATAQAVPAPAGALAGEGSRLAARRP